MRTAARATLSTSPITQAYRKRLRWQTGLVTSGRCSAGPPFAQYLAQAGQPCILELNAGIHDGHTGSVPISHSLEAFNAVADPADRIAPADIAIMTSERGIPDHLQAAPEDPAYGVKPVLFRRSSGRASVTIFAGGHELLQKPLRCWLEKLNDQR
jgi:hypothetical protein